MLVRPTTRLGSTHARIILFLLSTAGIFGFPSDARAQVLPAVAGGVGGLAAGAWTTIGAFVARSWLGQFIFDFHEVRSVRLETLPVLTFPIVGAALGVSSPGRLASVGAGAGIGYLGGGTAGLFITTVMSESPEAHWAGGIIGSTAGLLIGASIAALVYKSDSDEPPGTAIPVSIRYPVGESSGRAR